MTITNIPFQDTGHFPRLVMDYLSGAKALKPFYQYSPDLASIPAVIEAKSKEPVNREVLVNTLHEQYNGLILPEAVRSNIDALLNANTFCITTAHQLNIFTGPLYYIYKIACTINMCRSLGTLYPEFRFVPVYWMGSEDHDFEEINHLHVFGRTLKWDDPQGGSTGSYSTGSLSPLIEELKLILGDQSFTEEWIKILQQAYHEKTLTEATRILVHSLFGEFGLVVVDGNCSSLKNEFRLVMQEELLNRSTYDLVADQTNRLESLGYKVQATPREINLFYCRDRVRERIVLENSIYRILNTNWTFTREEILQELQEHPERFSPNVILRPLFQQKILPSLAYVGGAGELSYWLQLKPVFEKYSVNFPQLILRNSVLLIGQPQQEKMQKLGVNVSDLYMDNETLKKNYVLRTSGDDIVLNVEAEQVTRTFDQIREKAASLDPTLDKLVGAEQQKALQSIENIEKRLLKSQKQRKESELNQLEKLKGQLFPENTLQERYENIAPYYAALGRSLLVRLVEELDPYNKQFLVWEL